MDLKPLITCTPLCDWNDPLLDQVEVTYNESFPEEERRDFSLVRELLRSNQQFSIILLTKDEQYVGFISYWKFDGFTYAEHFAVDPAFRNGGIGGAALTQFIAFCATPIVLEVELPEDEMSKRRVGFYERMGFVFDNHIYFQPPYRKGEPMLELRLMTYGDIDLGKSFEHVKSCIHKQVYGVE